MIKLKEILQEQQSQITDLFIGQARPEFDSNSILRNISTAGEKVASALFTKLGAIDIEVTRNMNTSAVTNEIKKIAVKGLLLPGKLNSITISAHDTGCGKFNYDIMYSGETATEFWSTLAKFCNSNTKIFLGGCSVASEPKTVARIAEITKCEVTAPTGTYYPVTGVVSDDDDPLNLSKRLGNYLTCTNKPAGDESKYNKFIYAHQRDLFDPETPLSVGRKMSIIKDFRNDLNYISAQAYEKLNQNQTNEKLISTIMEQFTIRLIKDYIKSLGCYTSKKNPIQGTRQAIFK